jgi:hypothetical protein
MQKLRCTYQELRAIPAVPFSVFEAFMLGEEEAIRKRADSSPRSPIPQ